MQRAVQRSCGSSGEVPGLGAEVLPRAFSEQERRCGEAQEEGGEAKVEEETEGDIMMETEYYDYDTIN